MTARKKTGKFPQNPFAPLKGFCVSDDKPRKVPEAVSQASPSTAAGDVVDDATLFAEEMARLGISQSDGGEAVAEPVEDGAEVPSVASPVTDQELFSAALGTMDAVFADEYPLEEESRAEPRRMRQVRRGQLVPEARLDLHGLNRHQAREKVRFFLENGVYQGYRTVLLITGRGLGSGTEPVLRSEIERYLSHQAGAWVVEWGRAPRQYGGEGALVVFLKG